MAETKKTIDVEKFDLTMMSNFIHQVINPLNGVAGTLDNLAEGKIANPQRQVQRLNAARAQLEQCITLVRNLAFFAQGLSALETNRDREAVIPQVIIEAAMFFQEEAENRGIRIELLDRRTQNKVPGHPELLRQVLMNLFDNAVKYSGRGTEVTINQWRQKRTGSIIIEVTNTPASPVLSSDLPKVFELGFRGTNARNVVASGTGLGLYICRRIIEEVHNGTLRVQSMKGGKLQFTITLPPSVELRK